MPNPWRELCELHFRAASSDNAFELALGVCGSSDRQARLKKPFACEMVGRRVGGHQHLTLDRNPRVIIFFLRSG